MRNSTQRFSARLDKGKSCCAFPCVFFIGIFLLFSLQCFAANRTASVSGAWNATATWGGASVPVSGDDVTISSGVVVNITAAAACNDITITGTLFFGSGFDLTLDNGSNVMVSATGILIFDAGSQLLGGANNANGIAVKFVSGCGLKTSNPLGFVAAGGTNTTSTGSIAVNRGTRVAINYSIGGIDYTFGGERARSLGRGPYRPQVLQI